MPQILICLLTLLFSSSSPAMERNVEFLRSSIAAEGAGARLALPGVRQVDYSWGALNNYSKGGQMTALEHINYRHAFESGFSDGKGVRPEKGFAHSPVRFRRAVALVSAR